MHMSHYHAFVWYGLSFLKLKIIVDERIAAKKFFQVHNWCKEWLEAGSLNIYLWKFVMIRNGKTTQYLRASLKSLGYTIYEVTVILAHYSSKYVHCPFHPESGSESGSESEEEGSESGSEEEEEETEGETSSDEGDTLENLQKRFGVSKPTKKRVESSEESSEEDSEEDSESEEETSSAEEGAETVPPPSRSKAKGKISTTTAATTKKKQESGGTGGSDSLLDLDDCEYRYSSNGGVVQLYMYN